jgi:hypothetical protein
MPYSEAWISRDRMSLNYLRKYGSRGCSASLRVIATGLTLKLKEAQTKDQAKVERRFEARPMKRTIGYAPRTILPAISVEKAQHEAPSFL